VIDGCLRNDAVLRPIPLRVEETAKTIAGVAVGCAKLVLDKPGVWR